MIRKLITVILPLLIPAILYFTWVWLARRQAAKRGEEAPGPKTLREAPWSWLGIAGLALVILTLVSQPLIFRESGEAGTYVPPQYKDGKILPHRYEK